MTMDWVNQDMVSRTLLSMQRKGKWNMASVGANPVLPALAKLFPEMPRKKLIRHYKYWIIYYEREKERLT